MSEIDKKHEEFTNLCKPLIKFLNDNYHPHAKVIIEPTWGELVEGLMSCKTEAFIK